ncbi:hypothetical protein [Paraburkholderia kururiensis]|uniref:hypothetical protein n=1 Tax=Paraburkholderia kururiensis TaxID=984307 RepID=UPI000AAB9AC2|nr:hypothetical protein [Paraburkholderia kururiensis]
MADVREKILNDGYGVARRSPAAFMVGVAAGVLASGFLLYLAAKTMPDRFEPWGWMPVAERARLVEELQTQRARADALQTERDQLRAQNSQLVTSLNDRSALEGRCAQWNSEAQSVAAELQNASHRLVMAEIYDGPRKDGQPPGLLADAPRQDIETLRMRLAGLQAQVLQDCGSAR